MSNTETAAFAFHGAYYCGGCIAEVVVEHEPWLSLGFGHDRLTDDPDTDLLALARAVPASVRRTGLPVRLLAAPHPPSFCGHCLWWFADGTEGDSMIQSHMSRHTGALLNPESPEEETLTSLFTVLGRLADKHHGDSFAIDAAESIATGAIRLLNYDTGRIDQSIYEKQVRDEVTRIGGNPENL